MRDLLSRWTLMIEVLILANPTAAALTITRPNKKNRQEAESYHPSGREQAKDNLKSAKKKKRMSFFWLLETDLLVVETPRHVSKAVDRQRGVAAVEIF